MTFTEVCYALGIKQVCFDQRCGLSANRHKTGTLFLNVIHWRERRMSRRALRRFLLLVVRRDRLNDSLMLNFPKFTFWHLHHDSTEAGRLAANLGIRLPAALSRNDRLRCLTEARKHGIALSATYPAIYSWAKRGLD